MMQRHTIHFISNLTDLTYMLRDYTTLLRDDHVYIYTWVQPSTDSGTNQFLVAVLGK